jgi:hypothetical protein
MSLSSHSFDEGDDVVVAGKGVGDGLTMDLKKERKDTLYLCTIFSQLVGDILQLIYTNFK